MLELLWRTQPTFGHFDDFRAHKLSSLTHQASETRRTLPSNFWRHLLSTFFPVALSPYPSFIIHGIGHCSLKGQHPTSRWNHQYHLSTSDCSYFQKWRTACSLKKAFAPMGISHCSPRVNPNCLPLLSTQSSRIWSQEPMELFCALYPRKALEMSEAFDRVIPASSISKIKNFKSCLMYLFIHSPIHSTLVYGTPMYQVLVGCPGYGPDAGYILWQETCLFPNSSAHTSLDTMHILSEFILCN